MAEVNRVSESIIAVGKEIYGDKFTLADPKIFSSYKKVFYLFLDAEKGKSKGVLLVGNVGIGKSAMMRVYHRIFKDTERKFKWVSGYQLKDLSEQITVGEIKDYYGYGLKCDLYIDDIGFAVDVKRYGNTVNIISEIIMERYDLFISSGFKTHLSSNVLPTSVNSETVTIEKIYGKRVLDRLNEMCEWITWNGESLRK